MYGAATDSIVFGPFTDKGPWGSGEFWSGTVDGDTAVIEFYKRTDENGQGFEIFEISHILAELDWRLRSNEPDVLNCEVDASCYGDPEKNAVGRIIFNDNGRVRLHGHSAERSCPRSHSLFSDRESLRQQPGSRSNGGSILVLSDDQL